MNSLTTRKIVLGLLVTLVLAFSVQGTAEAITGLEATSPEELSIRVGDPFEIKFRVTLQSAVQIKDGTRYTTEDGTTLVDRSGYRIEAGLDGKYYILPDEELDIARENAVVGTRHVYLYKSGNSLPANTFAFAEPATRAAYFVDTSGNVKDGRGRDVYVRSGTGMRLDSNTGQQDDPYIYVRATTTPPTKVPDAERYHYNDEAVLITSPDLDLRLPNDFPVSGRTLSETDHVDSRLQSSMTLNGRALAVGDFDITIADATPETDYPLGSLARTLSGSTTPREPQITFTVRVSKLGVASLGRLRTTRDTESVSNQFLNTADPPAIAVAGTAVPANTDIIYRVTRGSGTLFYAGHTPTTALTVHKDTDVYINMNGTDNTVEASVIGGDHIVNRQSIVFEYIGTDPPVISRPAAETLPTIPVSTTSLSGAPGTTQSFIVTGGPAFVNISGTAFTGAGGLISGSARNWSVTLPNTAGSTYTLTIRADGYTDRNISVAVAAPPRPGTLSIRAVGTPSNLQQTVEVTATSAAGSPVSDVDVRLTGPFFTPRTVTTLDSGSVRAIVTIPSAVGSHTLTASAAGYNNSPSVTLSATAQPVAPPAPAPAPPPPAPAPTVSEPSSIQISGPATRSGTVNTQLDSPLLARVLDADGNGVPNARVIFRVRTGQGRLSARGNGRAVGVQTDASGFARTNYTPASASSTVEAEVRRVTRTVEFTITTGTAVTTRIPGPSGTPGTISPTVLVGTANRPPMIWVDGGAIYALVGASVERFAPSVDNAQNLAVGGGKVYWTEATGESGGTINSANLNGSGVTELASILATPMGIAVDTAGSKLYWTNSRGKIQSANLNGSGITDVIPGGLEGAMDIALAGGNAYWTQGGNVRFVNLRGQKQIRNVSTGTDTAGSLAIANGKVYWTEATGESGGTVNSANLNGSGATQLASILAAPMGIAVDTARSKLLWTNARGRIQSANLDGSGITNVVDGLGSPGDMVLSNSITAPTTATTTTTTTTTADNSKYDVNNDGSVDNTDASLVAAAMNTSNAQYDVNGDGTVNFLDLLLVFDNRDPGAAGAPTIVGMKLTAVQVDVLQEQIHLLIATGDRSPAAMRTLVYLQQLIATARPEQTQLLANYPNPFNPETWIPYELATDTDVRLTIYNTHGVVIRTLELGHQSSGYYVGRDRAAYWDGRNAYGEQVASGIYFYQFETDTMSSMRKMVILK